MRHHFFPTRSAGRWAIVFASALVGLAVAAPLAGASHSQGLACQGDQGHWVSVTDEQGVPNLELVGATVCTDALTGKACKLASQATQRSPYPGWVQVTDETGVPWLYQVGDEPTSFAGCLQTNVAASIGAGPTGAASPLSSWPPMKSPYPGWLVVFDEQGVPTLEPISQIR